MKWLLLGLCLSLIVGLFRHECDDSGARLWYGVAMEWRDKYVARIDQEWADRERARGPVITRWAPDSIDASGNAYLTRSNVAYDLTGWEFHRSEDSTRVYCPYSTVKFRAGWKSFPRRTGDRGEMILVTGVSNVQIGGLLATSTDH